MSIKFPKIILFGDSQVQRSFEPHNGLWGTLLANRFQRICDVIPRGFSGYTSRSGRIVLPSVFSDGISDVEAFVIFFGSNDYSGVDDPLKHHVPLEEYSENLKEMVKYLQSIGLGNDKIILITPGPYCDEKFMKLCAEIGRTFPKRDKELVLKYVDECVNVSKQLGVEVINIYKEMMKEKDWEKYLLDGVHLSRDGSFLVYELLLNILEKRIDTSKHILPYWRTFNHIHPQDAAPELCLEKSDAICYPVKNIPLAEV